MHVEEEGLFYINLKTQIGVGTGEPSDFLSHYQGEVELYDTEHDERICAGRVSLFLVHAEVAERAGMPLYDVLDAESKTAPFIALLHGAEGGNFSPAVLSILNDDFAMTRNMVILDLKGAAQVAPGPCVPSPRSFNSPRAPEHREVEQERRRRRLQAPRAPGAR